MIPVAGVDDHLPPVPAERLQPQPLRQRYHCSGVGSATQRDPKRSRKHRAQMEVISDGSISPPSDKARPRKGKPPAGISAQDLGLQRRLGTKLTDCKSKAGIVWAGFQSAAKSISSEVPSATHSCITPRAQKPQWLPAR
mgnify:CR=1 FL=1